MSQRVDYIFAVPIHPHNDAKTGNSGGSVQLPPNLIGQWKLSLAPQPLQRFIDGKKLAIHLGFKSGVKHFAHNGAWRNAQR